MSLRICEFIGTQFPKSGNNFPAEIPNPYPSKRIHAATTFRCASELASHGVSVDGIAGVLHNKVLVAASLSAAIGQLSKPFTSTLLYGKKFDFKAALLAGGFPSTHSSSDVAAATSLVLEKGFSDSIFGLVVIYADLTMYDAQVARHICAVLWALPVDGDPITGVDQERFKTLPEGALQETVRFYARAYILQLLMGQLLSDMSNNKEVKLIYLPLLRDLEASGRLSWGSVVLACLYRATKPRRRILCGPLVL